MLRNENPDTLASHNCTEDQSIVVFGVAISLIVIMLQTKSFVRVHSLVVSNIVIEKIQNCEHILSLHQYCGVDLVENCFGKVNKSTCMKKTLWITKCVFTLLHMRHCCSLSSVCLQNLKIYVLL